MNTMNGTPITPALARDLAEAQIETTESHNAKLTGKITENVPCPFPFPPPSPLSVAQAELRKAGETVVELMAKTDIVEELKNHGVDIDPEAVVEAVRGDVEKSYERFQPQKGLEELFDEMRAIPARDPDLREFKKQVIQAFKHLGLDTKQYFGV